MKIAVILPCFNEEVSIGETVDGFRAALPTAEIVVCDNNSSDRTAEVAREHGARVIAEPRPGKGEAVRRLFGSVHADVYVMADGDATYDPETAPAMVARLVNEDLDMVVGNRLLNPEDRLFRSGHRFGNWMFSTLVRVFFDARIHDLLSGYRVFSRRFARTFPNASRGFEIETELTVHALELRLPVAEVSSRYFARPDGSHSKLSTYRDGLRILIAMVLLFRDVKPLQFFAAVAGATAVGALGIFLPVYLTFLETSLVPRIPTVVLVMGMFVIVCLLLACGIILDRVSAARRYLHRLAYQAEAGPASLASELADALPATVGVAAVHPAGHATTSTPIGAAEA